VQFFNIHVVCSEKSRRSDDPFSFSSLSLPSRLKIIEIVRACLPRHRIQSRNFAAFANIAIILKFPRTVSYFRLNTRRRHCGRYVTLSFDSNFYQVSPLMYAAARNYF
jgi:hypothetical protein